MSPFNAFHPHPAPGYGGTPPRYVSASGLVGSPPSPLAYWPGRPHSMTPESAMRRRSTGAPPVRGETSDEDEDSGDGSEDDDDDDDDDDAEERTLSRDVGEDDSSQESDDDDDDDEVEMVSPRSGAQSSSAGAYSRSTVRPSRATSIPQSRSRRRG
jgi:hypothetical protein